MLIVPESKVYTDTRLVNTKETAMFSFSFNNSKEIGNVFSDVTIEINRVSKSNFDMYFLYNWNKVWYLSWRIVNKCFILMDLTTVNFRFIWWKSEYFERSYKRKLSLDMIWWIKLNALWTTIFANLINYLINLNKYENLWINAIELCPLYTAKWFYDKLIEELYLSWVISKHEIKVLEIDDDEPRDYYYFYI